MGKWVAALAVGPRPIIPPWLARSHRSGISLPRELPVLVDLHAVDFDVAALSKVDHHVPVQAAFILVAGLWVAGAQGEVDGAADLFVEERVARVAGDVVVGADGAL